MDEKILLKLAYEQEKLKAIDKLSSLMNKFPVSISSLAYLIHRIVEAERMDTDLSREVMAWGLKRLDNELTEIQREALKRPCPGCGTGKLHKVESTDGEEAVLWCNNCSLSMDGDGGTIN